MKSEEQDPINIMLDLMTILKSDSVVGICSDKDKRLKQKF